MNGLSPLLLFGIAAGGFVVVSFIRHWREWLRMPETPSTHIAGPDDQDVDFKAAIRSIGGHR